MLSVATMTCNGIPSGISERGREMRLHSGIGIVPTCLTNTSGCWRKAIPKIRDTSGIHPPSSQLTREIRNDLPFLFLHHKFPDVVLHVMTQGSSNPLLVPGDDPILGFLQVMTALCAILHNCPGDEIPKL